MRKYLHIFSIIFLAILLVGCSGILYGNKKAPLFSEKDINTPRADIYDVKKTYKYPGKINKKLEIKVNSSNNSPYVYVRPKYLNKKNVYENINKLPKANTDNNDPRLKSAEYYLNNERNINYYKDKNIRKINKYKFNKVKKLSEIKEEKDYIHRLEGKNNNIRYIKKINKTATIALLEEAKSAVEQGDYDKAASSLERAHRIEPKNAKILYDIAQIKYAQGKYRQAESFATKASKYSSNKSLLIKIWSLLSKVRKSLGDSNGAKVAIDKASSF